jgi:TetR/AcrR family transcriptional regulator, lmrAB and yxaGH operons repressor
MSANQSSREKMIASGARLFQRNGYHGTGLIEILEDCGAPKGSFYYHFPDGKEQLAEVAMGQASKAVAGFIDHAFTDAKSFSDGARRLANLIGIWFEKSGYSEGCPVTSVMLETVPSSPRLTTASQSAFNAWIAVTEAHALRLGQGDAANRLANALLVALEGAWVVARAQQSRRAFDIAGDFFQDI